MMSRAHQPAEPELSEGPALEREASEPIASEPSISDAISGRVPAERVAVQPSPRDAGDSQASELAGPPRMENGLARDGVDAEDDGEEVSPEPAAPSGASNLMDLEGEPPEHGNPPAISMSRELAPAARVATAVSAPEVGLSELDVAELAGSEMTASEMAALGANTPEPPPLAQGAPFSDWTSGEGPPVAAPRDPPWVDEVPDPVTPYEQRVSETIKVADLPPAEQLRGRVLANRYLAEEVADHTATSVSYRAYHLALDRAVTVRILPRGLACTDEACQEVRRVAALASGLDHPNIAATLDFGVLSDGWPFVVTDYFAGSTLAALVAREGKFVLRRVLHIGKQVATGLSVAHDAGLTHGLLNPDNVLIVEPGSPAEVVKLLGFGISKARGSVPGPPRSGVFGVPFYVSPEQASCRPLDARSDIYSLGVILYELMTGSPPFSDGDFAGVLCQHLDEEALPPSSRLRSPGALAKAMDAIVEKCLRKDPSKRYQTAAEVREDLLRLEVAAARTKRRPMPEVQRPTTTIHAPHPKAESTHAPGAKVIVHGDGDVPPRSSAPPGPGSAAHVDPSASPPAPGVRGVSPVPQASISRPAVSKAPRVRVDQATVKISAMDRDLILGQRPKSAAIGGPGGLATFWRGLLSRVAKLKVWLQSTAARAASAARRFIASAHGRDDAGDS